MNEALDKTAAEFVLGTLPADERARFAERLTTDAEARDAVAFWERRLAPLDAGVPEATPSPATWERIAAATLAAPLAADNDSTRRLRRELRAWRGAALAAGALAAGLAILAVIDRTSLPPASQRGRYVAVVNSDGAEPALIAEVDTRSGTIIVKSVTARAPSGKSLELWHVADGHAPRSLGILKTDLNAQTIRDAVAAGPVNGMIAVSVEPEGGSPTGAPTGPIVYKGELIPVE
jgi:anti-sigma-K factor RskA